MDLSVDESVVDQLREVGAPENVIKQALERVEEAKRLAEAKRESSSPEDFEVWSDCVESFVFFQSLRGQWAYSTLPSGLLIRTGIPSNRLEASFRLSGVRGKRRRDLLIEIRAMEQAVIDSDIERAIATASKDSEKETSP